MLVTARRRWVAQLVAPAVATTAKTATTLTGMVWSCSQPVAVADQGPSPVRSDDLTGE